MAPLPPGRHRQEAAASALARRGERGRLVQCGLATPIEHGVIGHGVFGHDIGVLDGPPADG
jgi:hypothetical protein